MTNMADIPGEALADFAWMAERNYVLGNGLAFKRPWVVVRVVGGQAEYACGLRGPLRFKTSLRAEKYATSLKWAERANTKEAAQ